MGSTTDNDKKQEEFWMTLIKKYEKRNLTLEQQLVTLQEQLEQKGVTPQNPIKEPSITSRQSLCRCDPCLARKSHVENDEKSIFSMSSADVQYMLQIKELVDRQKEMKQKLTMLQQNGLPPKAEMFKECKCEEAANLKNALLEENSRLTDELQNVKLEMQQCIERIKGPITRQIEMEKSKNKCLENQLLKVTENSAAMQQNLAAETEDLKSQLNSINQELSLLSVVNSKLEEELRLEKSKCNELEETLINQKLQEAEILKRLKNTQQEQEPSPPSSPCPCICPCSRRGAAGDKTDTLSSTKKRFSVTSEDLRRFPCYQAAKGGKRSSISSIDSKGSGKEKITKSTESGKAADKHCKCQTEKQNKESAKIQAEPAVAEAGAAAAAAEKGDAAVVTDGGGVEQTTATDVAETQEVTAETAQETAEAETDTAPQTQEAAAETAPDTEEAAT